MIIPIRNRLNTLKFLKLPIFLSLANPNLIPVSWTTDSGTLSVEQATAGLECIRNIENPVLSDFNDIIPDRTVLQAFLQQVEDRSVSDALLLPPVDSHQSFTGGRPKARFNFHKNDRFPIQHDQVDLSGFCAASLFEQAHAMI
jgi:hypothetical protein